MSTPSAPGASSGHGATASRAERLGAYQLLVELDSGGMGAVWLACATDGRNGPPLAAVKRPHAHLSGDATFLKMIVDEARLASAIDHPNVVRVRELGFEGGAPFIVMDYVEGASLAELRRELGAMGRALDARVATRIVLDALRGLHAAHILRDETGRPLNIVHRDVSPHNVLVGCDGRSLITDFGIAHAENRVQTTRTHEIKGKLAYMAPERVDRRRLCTAQSDVFSMGVVLWECLVGRRLFRSDEAVEVLQEVLSLTIPSVREAGARVSEGLEDVVARALSRDLDARYASAGDMATAIERAAGSELGTGSDVSQLVEAVVGDRMAERQATARAVIGDDALAVLLSRSGVPSRGPASASGRSLLEALAPPASRETTERRVRSAAAERIVARLKRHRTSKIAVAFAGVTVGVVTTIALGPYVTRTQQYGGASASAIAATGAATAAIQMPTEGELLDERDDPARVEDASTSEPVRANSPPGRAGSRAPRGAGAGRNGFTKLR